MAVNWEEVPGSKLIQSKWDVITTSLTMARDMLAVRLAYVLGCWTLPSATSLHRQQVGVAPTSSSRKDKKEL